VVTVVIVITVAVTVAFMFYGSGYGIYCDYGSGYGSSSFDQTFYFVYLYYHFIEFDKNWQNSANQKFFRQRKKIDFRTWKKFKSNLNQI